MKRVKKLAQVRRSERVRKLVVTGLSAMLIGGSIGAAAPAAYASTPAARVFNVYSTSFSPSFATDPSGVHIAFVNRDSKTHHIIAYTANSQAWSLDITLAPGQRYDVPGNFYCEGSCSYLTWLFRDADHSTLKSYGYGYTYCSGQCGGEEVKGPRA